MTLSDQDVQKQISQMVAFIQQDAKEKANEITQKVCTHQPKGTLFDIVL